jgi:hypothetical protein
MRKIAVVLAALAVFLSAGSPAVASTGRVVIDIVAVYGCVADSARVEVAPDNTSFHLWFDRSQVHIGPGAFPTDARRNCQVVLSIQMPDGSAYAIDRVEYGGYALIAPGAVFTQRARHHRTGQEPVPPVRSHSWTGPYDAEWQAVDTFPAEEQHFPPCGTNPDFSTFLGLRLDAGTSDPATETSYAGLDSVDGPYGAVYRLQTRPC